MGARESLKSERARKKLSNKSLEHGGSSRLFFYTIQTFPALTICAWMSEGEIRETGREMGQVIKVFKGRERELRQTAR